MPNWQDQNLGWCMHESQSSCLKHCAPVWRRLETFWGHSCWDQTCFYQWVLWVGFPLEHLQTCPKSLRMPARVFKEKRQITPHSAWQCHQNEMNGMTMHKELAASQSLSQHDFTKFFEKKVKQTSWLQCKEVDGVCDVWLASNENPEEDLHSVSCPLGWTLSMCRLSNTFDPMPAANRKLSC